MKNVTINRLIPLIAVAALVAVMASSALTMAQQAYANPCSITDIDEDEQYQMKALKALIPPGI